MTKTPKNQKSWEERFDKKFGEEYIVSVCESADAGLWLIKSFFRQELIRELEEINKILHQHYMDELTEEGVSQKIDQKIKQLKEKEK